MSLRTPEQSTSRESVLLHLVRPEDKEQLRQIAQGMGTDRMQRWFWSDEQRTDLPTLVLSFAMLFMNPANVVVGLGAAENLGGALVFSGIQSGWRAAAYVAIWDKQISRDRDLLWQATAVGFKLHNLHVLDAIVAQPNRGAHMVVKSMGFRKRGSFPDTMCYNNQKVDGVWYELDRQSLRDRGLLED